MTAEKIKLHPETPHQKRIFELADTIRNGAVTLFPTDSKYALGCEYTNKKGLDRIRQIRQLGDDHLFTLICDSLSGISRFAHLSDDNFKLIKRLIPGPFTFVLPATKEVPKLLLHPRRKTIGFRVPDYPICIKLIEELGKPMLATTARAPEMNDEEFSSIDRDELFRKLEKQVDLIIDDEQELHNNVSTILDLTGDDPMVLRKGLGMDRLEDTLSKFNVEVQE